MKKTAVEWLVEQLKDLEYDLRLIPNTIQRAKQIEKQQIVDANIAGMEFIAVDPNRLSNDAEQYYNETFENK